MRLAWSLETPKGQGRPSSEWNTYVASDRKSFLGNRTDDYRSLCIQL